MPEAYDIGKLLGLVRALSVPDRKPRVLRTMIRRRRPLPRPIVGLLGTPAPEELLVEIYRWLDKSGGRRATPRARVDLSAPGLPPDALRPGPDATGDEIEGHCLPILQQLVEGFSTDDTAMGPIKFPRYRTADWVTRQRVTSGETEAAVDLRRRLPRLLRSGTPTSDAGSASEAAAGDMISRVVFGIFALWPVLRLWMWVSGRIPGMSKVTRWFMHQRYLAPELSDSFLGFATRLTATGRSDENEEQIAKLLVHAFLEDLRDAYRRHILRPSGWRRTAYPVALLGPVAPDSAGARLLARINDIRNETGLFDPLVVLAFLQTPPALPAAGELARVGDLTHLDTLESLDAGPPPEQDPDPLHRWLHDIDTMRTNRLPHAWYLPLRVRLPDPLGGGLRDDAFADLAEPPAPPLAARRWVVGVSLLVPVALVVVAALVAVPPLRGYVPLLPDAPCGHWPWTSGISVNAVGTGNTKECVGYSDNAAQVFSSNAELRAMQHRVFELNDRAEKKARDESDRPLVTLIYFGGFTHASASARYPLAQAEELAGVAVQQQWWLDYRGPNAPVLRVVIANGGTEMSHAVSVVEDHLSALIAADSTVIGVIGMDRSTTRTRDAITRLGRLGVPTVATTLSADELIGASPLYFQAVPSNSRQTKLIADYIAGARYPAGSEKAGRPLYTRTILYYSKDPDDIYVSNLIYDLSRELRERRIPFEERSWNKGEPMSRVPSACRSDDSEGTLLFYAARNEDFANFAKMVGDNCSAGDGPTILGNDTFTRVLADPEVVRSIPPLSTVRYAAYAAPVMLDIADCRDGTDPEADLAPTNKHLTLCRGLPGLIEYLRQRPEIEDSYRPNWPGDRLALGYDTAGVLVQAAMDSRRGNRVPDRAAVAVQLRETTYAGASGEIDFTVSRVAEQALIAVLGIEFREESPMPRCLVMRSVGSEVDSNRCPPKEGGVSTNGAVDSLDENWVEPVR